jgi:hypothetical protein
MIKAIVTKQNADGTFDEVGMNNRTIIGPYKRLSTILKHADEWAGPNKTIRVELYRNTSLSLQDKPYDTAVRITRS